MKRLTGVAASRGICIGPVFQFVRKNLEFETIRVENPEEEIKRLQDALIQAKQEIQDIYEKALTESSRADAEIFQAHKMILDDPEFIDSVHCKIENESVNAETALQATAQSFFAVMAAMDDEYFSARATDIMDVANRVLRIMLGISESPTAELATSSIIVADDLTPADTILLDKSKVLGFCIAGGSATSHTAILARGLGLPAVAGVGEQILSVKNGTVLVLDGTHGLAIVEPDEKIKTEFHKQLEASRSIRNAALEHADAPAITKDGKKIEIAANIGNVEDAKSAIEQGAEGVGLLRTEFLYLERASLPDEEEQFQAYRAILDVFGDKPVILRTLDVGGDKEIPYLSLLQEMNPFLGERALRLCLARPDIFKPQLRAALRAGVGHNLKIMYPMVAIVGEVRAAREVYEECLKELKDEGLPFAKNIEVGIMVEIPSAAVVADQLAREVDFFSIGTNDLSQYTMAADRTNPRVANLTSAFQPAVLRLVRDVINAAHAEGKWVGMCGELAGEPCAAPILIGLGLDEFSMSPPFIPIIKQIIRNLNASDMSELAQNALNLETPDEVRELVQNKIPFLNEIAG